MKKSEIYKMAQIAVLENHSIPVKGKLEVLKELMDREKLEKFCEEQAEKEQANEAV